MREVDVAVLGGGLAGQLLARQLRRRLPSASVVLVEKATKRDWKVGESTVEVAGNYLVRRLGLSTYLHESHLPKNGLRFFFDREDRSASLDDASEIGSARVPPYASFQIDRARFEEDLLAMNAQSGVDVRQGVRVLGVRLGQEGERHEVALSRGDIQTDSLRARWVVDATGRASLLSRQEGLRVESDLGIAAVWGRFRGLVDIDDHGTSEFRGRMAHSPRRLSTSHFCFPGGWIWLIPLGRGVVSVGAVMDKALFQSGHRTEAGFMALLREHRAVAEIIEGAQLLDVRSFGQLAYGTTRFFDGRRRYALVGEAAAFADPLYSPGSDFIAIENDQAADLVARDLGGESLSSVAERAHLYDRYVAERFQSAIELYRDLYGTLGSFELFASKWDFDLLCYLDRWFQPYLLDHHLDLEHVRREIEGAPVARAILRTFKATLRDAEDRLRSKGGYFAKNTGHSVADPILRFMDPSFGTDAYLRRGLPRLRDGIALVVGELAQKIGARRGGGPLSFSHLTMERSLL